ncbi:MAG: ABC transporter substrate-binding protein [Actinomycetota bacterium]
MKRRTWYRLLAILAALALVAAACGSDDDDATAEDDATETAEDTGGEDAASDDDAMEDEADAETEDAGGEDTAESSGEPIKIGALTSLTGNFTPWGIQARDGMQLAVNDLNDAGGIDGRPVELVVFDDQSNAEEAVIGLERMIEDGVVAVGGAISSDVGLNTAQFAEQAQIPLFLVKAGSDAILTRDSRYTFRTCIPSAPMVAEPIAQYAQAEGLTRIGAIIADYGWGRSIEAAMQDSFDAVDGLEYQIEVAPVPEQDFTTYLRSLESFGPELIVATGHPPGSGAITVQSADLGLDAEVTGAYTPWALVAGGAGDAAVGRYADFKCADFESDSYQELAPRYLEISDNTFMEDDAIAGYGIVTMIAAAIEAVGDDPVAMAEWLHTQSFDLPGYAFPMSWTEWGELAEAAPIFSVLGPGPAPEGVNEAGDWYPETLIRPEPLTPYEPS